MTRENLHPNIELFHSHLAMPTEQLPLVQLPLTSSLITLTAAKVLLAPHPSLTHNELLGMGDVTDIVAPNLFHHLGIANAMAVHPKAKLWGVAGFEQKRNDIAWHGFLDAGAWPYTKELTSIHLAGMPKMNEFLFLHPSTKTLFITDLCFNILSSPGLGA
jgi:hypothetical protein